MTRLEFDGTPAGFIGIGIAATFLTILTLGFGFPWATTMILRWKNKHTIIDGKRLQFVGSGSGLIGKWIVWLILTFITFGVYGFFVWVKYQKWVIENTGFSKVNK